MAKKSEQVKVRLLGAAWIEGVRYEGNDVVTLNSSVAEQHAGEVDSSPGAVAYCEKELGKTAIEHRPV
jgi:hypothetical protein